jgi:hypothetical protein
MVSYFDTDMAPIASADEMGQAQMQLKKVTDELTDVQRRIEEQRKVQQVLSARATETAQRMVC